MQKFQQKSCLRLIQQLLTLGVASISINALADDTTTLEEIEARNPQKQTVPATGSDAPIEIEGDKLEMYLDRKMRATGNAKITKGNQSVAGDKINYDVQNDELMVEGNAVVKLDGTTLNGPKLKMRLSDSIGEMQNASLELGGLSKQLSSLKQAQTMSIGASQLLDGQTGDKGDPKRYLNDNALLTNDADITKPLETSRGDAEVISFEGENKKRLKKARFTTCAADVDDWYIKANDLDIDSKTRIIEAKHAHIEFKGVPILYTPWLRFSYNNQRESGFLAPSIGATSRSGAEVLIPYYWNISPNKDATLGARFLSKRGLQLQGEFRYLEPLYSGVSNVEYLNKDSESDDTRFYYNFRHRHSFDNGWSAGFNLERVSDDQYFSELSSNIASTSRVNLAQTAFVNYNNESWNFNGLVQRYQTLDDLSFAYSRLPQLTLSYYREFERFTTEFSTQYTYFDRNNDAPIAPTGSRFVNQASVAMPMGNAFSFLTPKLSLNLAHYDLKDNNYTVNGNTVSNNSKTRVLPTFSLDAGLFFDADKSYFGTDYTQTFEPRIFYLYVPEKNQNQIPVFDTGLTDLNLTTLFIENQFTGYDRINNANQISLALTTKLIEKDGIERISATIGQRIYFDDQTVVLPGTATSNRSTSDLIAGVTASLSSRLKLDAFTQYNPSSNQLERSNLLARYNPEPGKLFNVGYRLTRDLLEQIDVSGQWPLGKGWYGVGRVNYSLRESTPIETLLGLEYDSGCWQARTVLQRLETATSDANYSLFFQLELGGLASIGSNPLNLLRRDIPGYLTSGQLPDFYRQQNY